jgi:uroporphyrin-III C-methyltransferase
MKNKLILIGAGPGATDLITLRAIERLQKAKVILYDALVNEKLLDFAPQDALKIYVGKRGGKPSFTQEKINQLIVSYALIYGEVIRLKGGDPFIFGRGLEEIFFAKKHGIEAEVIPGISSATGLTALNQISLTHRGVADGFWVLTASKKGNEFNRDLELAAQSNSTVVVLMGIGKLKEIAQAYLSEGRKDTPVLIIQNGSTLDEKILVADIGSIVYRALEEKIESPAIIVIGEVVEAYQQVENTEAVLSYLN